MEEVALLMKKSSDKANQLFYQYLAVALGGIIGALLRETIELMLSPNLTDHIPIATMLINWSGSLVLAWFYTKTIWHWRVPQWFRVGVGTGIIGAFTTFSTFSVEADTLISQNIALGFMYIVSSVVGGLGFSWIGLRLAGEKAEKKDNVMLNTQASER